MNTLPCILCEKDLEPSYPGQTHIQPNDGIVVQTSGSYGSRVYDMGFELPERSLVFVICDECLVERGDSGMIAEYVGKDDAVLWRASDHTRLWMESDTHEEYEEKLKEAGLE